MATDATFDNQLQALATATANFANGKDAAIKNTIIIALGGSTQSGGGASKIEPVLTFGEVNRDTVPVEIPFEYNGDGMIFARSDATRNNGVVQIDSDNSRIFVEQPCNVTLYAAEGERYAAKFATYSVEIE